MPARLRDTGLERQAFVAQDPSRRQQLQWALTRLTNEYRRQQGLPKVVHQPALVRVAHRQAQHAARFGYISHEGFPEQRQSLLVQLSAPPYQPILAENLASFRSSESDPDRLARAIFQLWVDSPAHRRNLLGPYGAHGASIASGPQRIYAAALFQ
jgi:uncharacterized protein YkwD